MSQISDEFKAVFETIAPRNSVIELIGPITHDPMFTEGYYPGYIAYRKRGDAEVTELVRRLEYYFGGVDFLETEHALQRTATYLQSAAALFLCRSLVYGLVVGGYQDQVSAQTVARREEWFDQTFSREEVHEQHRRYLADPDMVTLMWMNFMKLAAQFAEKSGMTKLEGHQIHQIWRYWDLTLTIVGIRFYIVGVSAGRRRRADMVLRGSLEKLIKMVAPAWEES